MSEGRTVETSRLQAPGSPTRPFQCRRGDQTIELSQNRTLVISRAAAAPSPVIDGADEDCVRLLDAKGSTSLLIRITDAGALIELGGGSVGLRVDGDLAIAAKSIVLHGEEGVAVSSGKDVRVSAGENCTLEAKRQKVVAARGNVDVYANDDVKIDGERIRMNC